jgi:hypothetical protein
MLYSACLIFWAIVVVEGFTAVSPRILVSSQRSSAARPITEQEDGDETTVELNNSRRNFICKSGHMIGAGLLSGPQIAAAASAPALTTPDDAVASLAAARETLQKLLDNWERAVIDCTFADVPRELLAQKNKEELLEKASTFALFDKSVSVETCKTTNRVVRDYLGVSGIGPLVGLEKQLKKALERVDPDLLDDYVTEIELIQQTLSKARSLSYTAGVADFSSVNNFEKDEVKAVLSTNSNLEQTRQSIQQVVDGLGKIEAMFQ